MPKLTRKPEPESNFMKKRCKGKLIKIHKQVLLWRAANKRRKEKLDKLKAELEALKRDVTKKEFFK